jgi:uncharacterized protein YndB with AHSA1/START domain
MTEFREEVWSAAQTEHVWSVVTDLEHYPAWTAALVFGGHAEADAPIVFTIQVPKDSGRVSLFRFDAKVLRFEPPHDFAWTCGVPGVLSLTFGFVLLPERGGTRIAHHVRAAGLLTIVARRRLKLVLPPVLKAVTADLQRRLAVRKLHTLRHPPRRSKDRRPGQATDARR